MFIKKKELSVSYPKNEWLMKYLTNCSIHLAQIRHMFSIKVIHNSISWRKKFFLSSDPVDLSTACAYCLICAK